MSVPNEVKHLLVLEQVMDESGRVVATREALIEVSSATLEELASRGRAADCDCGLIECACKEARTHELDCNYRRVLTLRVGIDCEHGRDVCPICDPCDCAELAKEVTDA